MNEASGQVRPVSVATWNMDYWKQPSRIRKDAWSFLGDRLDVDIALLQECVPPKELPRSHIMYREIGGSRRWGSAVAAFGDELSVEEIGAVRTRYGPTRFPMLGTQPGSVIVAEVMVPGIGPLTCVSVYAVMGIYSQTTMFRIVADLIPLFDSPQGERVILGGDFNLLTPASPNAREFGRYEAILRALESLGLQNVAETAEDLSGQFENCPCGASPCYHLWTYGENPGKQLDWLFASPELARRCRSLGVERERSVLLSDHAPIVALFDVPVGLPRREWDPESFVSELGIRAGPLAAEVAEEIVAWAQHKTAELQQRGISYARLDRLPVELSSGEIPQLWVQLDMKEPRPSSYTISMTAEGRLIVQFQHMRAAPFDREEARRDLWVKFNELPGVELDNRLNGRPWFPLQALGKEDSLEQFLRILEHAVDEMVGQHG